jgi:hypothetical protein
MKLICHKRIWCATGVMLLMLAAYFEPTHCVRGWLWGKAFFDGRPTSYWRIRCDEWTARCGDVDSFTQETWLLNFEIPGHPGMRRFGVPDDLELKGSSLMLPRETFWKRFREAFQTQEELDREKEYNFAPKILWATPDSEPVLLELRQEEKYTLLTKLALRRVAEYRKVQEALDKAKEAAP